MGINYADKIVYNDLNEMIASPFFTTVLYGETAKRKTTTACSMVIEHGMLVCADDSWKVLKKSIHDDIRDKVRHVEFDSVSQLEYLDFEPYDTIILDPVTAMVESYLDLLFENANWPKGGYRETLVTQHEELKGTSTTAPIDYKVTRDRFRPVFTRLVQAPCHVIFTAHVNHPIKGLSADMTKRPALPEATWNILSRLADVVGFVEAAGKGRFTVNVDESAMSCVAKSRIEGIEGKMDLNEFVEAYRKVVS